MKKFIIILFLFFTIFSLTKLQATESSFVQKNKKNIKLDEKNLPNILKDWVEWSKYDKEKNNCHFNFSNNTEKYCYYISQLNLNINNNSLSFVEKVSLMEDGYIQLPGSLSLFPFTVKIDNKIVPVINMNNLPYLFLSKGNYTITGEAKTVGNIRNINIPNDVALLNVKKNNKIIPFINLDSNSILRLENQDIEKNETDAINILAFRKIEDTIPIKMTLILDLNVSGKDRTETFKNMIPNNFAIMSINSNIPTYIQKNGNLLAEVKSGRWNITIEYRQLKESLKFSTKNLINDNEIWVFVGNQNRRIIQMPNNILNIQTTNTLLPESWKKYPAYNISSKDNIILNTINYNTQKNDEINLVRNIKLSFDGKFYSIDDNIKAFFTNNERMNLEEPFKLSSVSIDNIPQPITNIEDDEEGFEIRKGNYDIKVNSRIEKNKNKIPATGYNKIINNVIWNLNLSPGYELFYITGADFISNSWITNWNLLNIFIVILLSVFLFYLFDFTKAFIGTILIILLHPLLPDFTIVCFILCITILFEKYFTINPLVSKINLYIRYSLLLLTTITIISFEIIDIRWNIYPALAEPIMENYFFNFLSINFLITFYLIFALIFILSYIFNKENQTKISKIIKICGVIFIIFYMFSTMIEKNYYKNTKKYTIETKEMTYDLKTNNTKIKKKMQYTEEVSMFQTEKNPKLASSLSKIEDQLDGGNKYQNQNISKNKIQAGLGFPEWNNLSQIKVELKGPIDNKDIFNIFLISPKINIMLSFLRLFLSLYFIYVLSNLKKNQFKENIIYITKKLTIIIFTIIIPFLSLNLASAETIKENSKNILLIPDNTILEEIKNRTSAINEPSCIPFCISIPSASISNIGDIINLNLSINSADEVVIPLPTLRGNNINSIKIENILNNGKEVSKSIKKDNIIFLKLNTGINNINIKVILDKNSDKFFLNSQIPIHYLKNNLIGFKISSNEDNNKNFQIIRVEDSKVKNNSVNKQFSDKAIVETFFTINRYIDLENIWQIKTIVIKNNNISENATIDVPLLKNEKVIVGDGSLSKDKFLLSFSSGETEKIFNSIIPIEKEIILSTSDEVVNYNEVWIINIDFIWNFKLIGLEPIITDSKEMIFFPSSGSRLKIFISELKSVDGNTLRFNKVNYSLKPGRSIQELKFVLDMQSSDTGFHNIQIPEKSEVKDLKINEEDYPIIVKENNLVIPVNKGNSVIKFTLNIKTKISNILKFPKINLNAPTVNIIEDVYLPVSRWVLFTHGPKIGPSVLFWAQIPLWLFMAYILSKIKIFPLKFINCFVLLFGLMQTNIIYTVIVISWFFLISTKNKLEDKYNYKKFINILVIIMTLLFFYSLFQGVNNGLLGTWNMKIIGNDSKLIYENGNKVWNLIWYQDISNGELPQPMVISLSIWFYRLMMIVWSIWLSFSFVKWSKWAMTLYKNKK